MDSNQQPGFDQDKYLDNAIRAVQDKKPLPEIDFTLHTMEDGTQVSTMERVCKGMTAPTAVRRRLDTIRKSRALFSVTFQLTPP